MFLKFKNDNFNNRDFNFDPNNRGYDFFHNGAALSEANMKLQSS